jgi:F0F1-type ATP synthase membrane subunit c/vacuolar-type H+-ATPase subunit K
VLAGAANTAGVVGAMLISGLYLLNQMGRLATTDWRFPGGNLLGSLLIFLSLVETFNLPSVLIELFWSAISVFGLVRSLGRGQAGKAGLCPDPPKSRALWKPPAEASKS